MATYAQLEDLTGYLSQFRDVDADNPDLEVMDACLTRAEGFVNRTIKTPAALTAAAEAERIIYGNGLQTLVLPPYVADSVTLVEAPSGYTVPDYIEMDGSLVITDSSGIVVTPYRSGLAYAYGSTLVWTYGVPYTVSATFGWSADDLAVLTEATLQIAVQLWRYKDAGGSGTVGNEEATTEVKAGYTPLVKQGLEDIAQRVRGFSGGIW